MFGVVLSAWPLFLGVLLLTLGHGLQGTLLGVRADVEEFPPALTGLVLTGYAVGFFVGTLFITRLIALVGHVRVFAAFGSIASCAILLHPILVDPLAWFLLRCVSGFALSATFVVTESWLNSSTNNDVRGQVLSAYLITSMGGITCGQFLLNVAPVEGFVLFILASILLSLAFVPILLSNVRAPALPLITRVKWTELYQASPLGLVTIVAIGVAQGALLNVGAVYALEIGFTVAGTAAFMAIAVTGGVVFQWPIGYLSDKFDRRTVITWASIAVAMLAVLAASVTGRPTVLIAAFFFLISGLSMPLYAQSVAHLNDHLPWDKMVAASGTILLAYATGLIIGPSASGLAIQLLGPAAFPLFIGLLHAGVASFAFYRMTRRPAVPLEAQGQSIALPAAPTSAIVTTLAQETAAELSESAHQDDALTATS